MFNLRACVIPVALVGGLALLPADTADARPGHRGAITTTQVLDSEYCDVIIDMWGDELEVCSWVDGVLHTTLTPSGKFIRIFQGEEGFETYKDGEFMRRFSFAVHNASLRDVGDNWSYIMWHHDACVSTYEATTDEQAYFQVDLQIAGGEIVGWVIEEVDYCK